MRRLYAATLLSIFFTYPPSASADTPPSRKSGLWEVSISSGNSMPNHTMTECVDQANDSKMAQMGNEMTKSMGRSCTKNEFKRTAAGFETTTECAMGGSTIKTNGSFTGDFESNYRGEITTSFTPPMPGRGASKTIIVAKYKGACASDMKPGDMIVNGMKMNHGAGVENTQDAAKMLNKKGIGSVPTEGMSPEQMKAISEAMKNMENMGH